MVNCPKCGTAVKEEKAFCHNCGSPMNPLLVQPTGGVDFGATMIEPPKRNYVPPVAAEVQRGSPEAAPMSYPHGGASASPLLAATPGGKRKTSALSVIGFILLVLFLMLVAFGLALWLD